MCFVDWSVLYVFVAVFVALLLLSTLFWGIAMACRQTKKPRSRPKLQKYSLIGTQDTEAPNCKLSYHRFTNAKINNCFCSFSYKLFE